MSYHSNLFEYAPRELSHSAFWAWVLDSLNTSSGEFSDVRALAQRLLDAADVPIPDEINVTTESPLETGANRIDIHALLDGERELLIENKVSARPSVEQLTSYQEASNHETAHFLLLSTAFPMQKAKCAEQEELWTFLQAPDLLTLLKMGERSHPVLSDYHEWLKQALDEREELATKARSSKPDDRREAIKTLPGQWAFMERVVEPFEDTGRQYGHRSHSGGAPWTEFRFIEEDGFEGNDEGQDAVFYRLERLSAGPMFRVHQYQDSIGENWSNKKERLSTLRDLWHTSVAEAGELPWEDGSNRGKKRCEISRIGLDEFGAEEIAAELASVHEVFVHKIVAEFGWDVDTVMECGDR